MQPLTVSDYSRLVALVLFTFLLSAANFTVVFVYNWFPFKRLLGKSPCGGALFPTKSKFLTDWVFDRTSQIKENFALHLGDDKVSGDSPFKMTSPQLLSTLGFGCQEHQVTTADGYVLVLHRVLRRPTSGISSPPGVPLLVQHGLMQDSEAWLTTGQRSLPCILAHGGFDVWLGNNRGNKYSCKHLHFSRKDTEFWDFSLDDMARFDVPACIDHIRAVTMQDKVAYVGFSQGSAQMFAALSIHPSLSSKVLAFAALSAAVGVRGLQPSVLTSLIEADKNFLHLFFGRSVMMPQAMSWRSILSPSRYAWLIHHSVSFLFGWDMSVNMTQEDCTSSFAHIYSYSSVKAVVHWFQIIRAKRFQCFMDDSQQSLQACPPLYDVKAITAPIAVFMGGKDSVVDALASIQLLPAHTYVFFEPTYSHLDFKWARGLSRPGRAFESLLAFLHSASPEAAEQAREDDMMRLLGTPSPVLLNNPDKLATDISKKDPRSVSAEATSTKITRDKTFPVQPLLVGSAATEQGEHARGNSASSLSRSPAPNSRKDAAKGCSAGFVRDICCALEK